MSQLQIDQKALLRLMQISSAALPVGGYAFSQGLESAIEMGFVKSYEDTQQWLQIQLKQSLAKTDLPMLALQMQHLRQHCYESFLLENRKILAMRETKELRLSDTATGLAMAKLLVDLSVPIKPFDETVLTKDISFVSSFAIACVNWNIDTESAFYGFLWSWLENQVAAATKLVPLGQVSAQQLLSELLDQLSQVCDIALNLDESQIGASLPGLALISSWHETQYSRLFRS